jgi:signal peptidase I
MTPSQPRPRKQWLAGVLNVLTPGLGHLYAGSPRRALARYVGVVVVGSAVIALVIFGPVGRLTTPILFAGIIGLYAWLVIDGVRAARAAAPDYVLRRYNRWYVYAAAIALASFVTEIPKLFLEALRHPSGSMEPTLLLGDWFFVKKGALRPAPELGQLVVLESPERGMGAFAKRIVGMPGDTLQMRGGVFTRNGARPAEPFVDTLRAGEGWSESGMSWQKPRLIGIDTSAVNVTSHDWGPLVVPRDSFFVMGDNRDASRDSRSWGFVGADRLRGVVHRVYYSYDPQGDRPFPFLTAIRWERGGLSPR